MAFPADTFPFTPRLVAGSPEQAGVYVLWHGTDVIYIGHAKGRSVTIRSSLVRHLSGEAGPCTGRATHYGWVICTDPAAHEAALVAEYRAEHKRLPRCNASE